MTDERTALSIREIGQNEIVTWLDISEHAGRPVLRQWQQIGSLPATITARYWLEKVRE
jgi:hypothetical protein